MATAPRDGWGIGCKCGDGPGYTLLWSIHRTRAEAMQELGEMFDYDGEGWRAGYAAVRKADRKAPFYRVVKVRLTRR